MATGSRDLSPRRTSGGRVLGAGDNSAVDTITCSLMAHAEDDDATNVEFGLAPYSEHEEVEEVVVSIRWLLDRADPPGKN